MGISVNERRRIKSKNLGLPREDKYPINTKARAISAVAYAKKNAHNGNITPQERDRILHKVHQKYPEIQIKSTSGFKMR